MSWWTYIPAAISAVGAITSSMSSNSQNSDRRGANMFNAQNRYDTEIGNIAAQTALASVNAQMVTQAGKIKAKSLRDASVYNAGVIQATTMYNDALMENELSLMWESVDLDLLQLTNQRARERGTMISAQSASGTVIGVGSNEDTLVDQKTQEMMDALIIKHGADIQASKIANARAQGIWKGAMETQKVMWEGEVGAVVAETNSFLQAQGAMMSAEIAATAGKKSASNQLISGMMGADMDYSQNSQLISNNLMSGMFGAASAAVSAYGRNKEATSQYGSLLADNS